MYCRPIWKEKKEQYKCNFFNMFSLKSKKCRFFLMQYQIQLYVAKWAKIWRYYDNLAISTYQQILTIEAYTDFCRGNPVVIKK